MRTGHCFPSRSHGDDDVDPKYSLDNLMAWQCAPLSFPYAMPNAQSLSSDRSQTDHAQVSHPPHALTADKIMAVGPCCTQANMPVHYAPHTLTDDNKLSLGLCSNSSTSISDDGRELASMFI